MTFHHWICYFLRPIATKLSAAQSPIRTQLAFEDCSTDLDRCAISTAPYDIGSEPFRSASSVCSWTRITLH